TLSLHDALPIWPGHGPRSRHRLRDRQAERGPRRGRDRTRAGDDVPHLPPRGRGTRAGARSVARGRGGRLRDRAAGRGRIGPAQPGPGDPADQGYKVISAGSGAEALTLARAHKGTIDLLVTDVVMPGMDGRELADRLGPIHPETRCLFMSGYTDDAVVRRGVREQGMPFLQKPFSIDALALKVREVLDQPARALTRPEEGVH